MAANTVERLRQSARSWRRTTTMRVSGDPADVESVTIRYLMYVLLPAWFVPGVADYLMHRRTRIERTSGVGESAIHALMMAEISVPLLLTLLCEVNPLVLGVSVVTAGAHEATAIWDVRSAIDGGREVRPAEQHIHSFLESLPFMAMSALLCLHWDQVAGARDAGSRGAYSTDASNYRQVPVGVVVPRTVADAVQAVAVCREHGAPVASRGGGTSLAGQACNAAVVIDWSKYCHGVVSVDPEARTCIVEPGIVLDELNSALAPHKLMFGPRPATHDHRTLGGMIGNNSCGATAQAYGKTVDNVLRLEVLTYDGERFWAGPTSDQEYEAIVAAGGGRAVIYRQPRELAGARAEEIRRRYPDIPRRVSGYNLDSLLPEQGFDVARALVGSESTLVTVLHAELRLVPKPAAQALVVLGYPDIASAADAAPAIAPHHPEQLEGIDGRLITFERERRPRADARGQRAAYRPAHRAARPGPVLAGGQPHPPDRGGRAGSRRPPAALS